MTHAEIRPFFDEPTNTVTYLVWDPSTRQGAVIDPVLDWDNRSGTASTAAADAVLAAAGELGVAIRLVLETHAHADHLTAAPCIKARTGAPIGIGEHIREVQRIFRPVFDAHDLKPDAGLAAPLLPLPSIRVNIRAGRFPAAEANGVRHLKVPVRTRTPESLS